MARPKIRRVTEGVGWAMSALLLTTAGLRLTHWATLHAAELDGVMIAAAVLSSPH